MTSLDDPAVPPVLRTLLTGVQEAVEKVSAAASAVRTIALPPVSFEMRHLLPTPDIMSPEDRAQSISFVTRYEGLPPPAEPVCTVDAAGRIWLSNENYMRHTLNEFRPIVMNETDRTHYLQMHQTWRARLSKPNTALDLLVRAKSDTGDITPLFVQWLDQTRDAIKLMLRCIDLDFLYNGVLQHSDARHSERLVEEYTSGDLALRLLKAANILWDLKHFLAPYYTLAHTLNFPQRGPIGVTDRAQRARDDAHGSGRPG